MEVNGHKGKTEYEQTCELSWEYNSGEKNETRVKFTCVVKGLNVYV